MTIPFPKEHGVWAMLFTSLVIGFAVAGRVTAVGLAVTISLSLLLMLKAPIKDLLRGRRDGALFWGGLYLLLSALLILPFLPALNPTLTALTLPVMAVCIPWYFYGLARKREMQIRFEIPAMALLALAAAFAYRAGGGDEAGRIVGLWFFCLLFYAASSFRVRSTPRSPSRKAGMVYVVAVLCLVGLSSILGASSPLVVVAFLPLLEDLYRALRPRKESFADLGRIELVKTLLFAVFLIAGLRS